MLDDDFNLLLDRARGGDEDAAAEIVARYCPHVLRVIRRLLDDPKLRQQMDSIDVLQSVMADFFDGLKRGTLILSSSEQLFRLLMTMANHNLLTKAAAQRAACRDVRRLEGQRVEDLHLAAPPKPTRSPDETTLVAGILDRLTLADRYLLERRAGGARWLDLAQELSMEVDAVRIRHGRLVERINLSAGGEPCAASQSGCAAVATTP